MTKTYFRHIDIEFYTTNCVIQIENEIRNNRPFLRNYQYFNNQNIFQKNMIADSFHKLWPYSKAKNNDD